MPYQSFWDSLIQTVTPVYMGVAGTVSRIFKGGPTIANTWPDYEVLTPQYPNPNPYPLALTTYRKNELVYACVEKRSMAIAEAPARLYDGPINSKTRTALDDHPARKLLERPNEAMSETDFWIVNEIYTLIAGYSIWEIEFDNAGKPINLWPMRPDWCSTRRGRNRPLEYVRYQPYGLPPQDIPIENLLIFQEFDPIFPMLKGLSKAAIALRTVSVDNAATDFLASFFQRGAIIGGILSTEQNLKDAEAEHIRTRWRQQHGGTENWGDIAVLGNGTKYQSTQMNFKEMDFAVLDGRSEARICQVFGVMPILVSARIGLDRSTYNNYENARKAFYEETVEPRWRWYQTRITHQLLPHYSVPAQYTVEFDTSRVSALQENTDALWKRVREFAKLNLITRDESRAYIGKDPVDHAPVFVGVMVRADNASDLAPGGPGELGISSEQAAVQQDTGTSPSAQSLNQVMAATSKPRSTPAATIPSNFGSGEIPATLPASGAAEHSLPPAKSAELAALTEWRRRALDALKRSEMYLVDPSNDQIEARRAASISVGLVDCKSATEIRALFDRYWPAGESRAWTPSRASDAHSVSAVPENTMQQLIAEIQQARQALETAI